MKVYNRNSGFVPEDSVYIGRGTPWGNPFRIGVFGTRIQCIEAFEKEILPSLDVEPLRGKNLVCNCAPKRCHGDSILKKLYGDKKDVRYRFA